VWQVNRNTFDFLYGTDFAGFATNIYDTPVAAIPASTFDGGDLESPFPISRSLLLSTFASDTLSLWGDRVLLTGGVRRQEIRVKSYNYYNAGQLDGVYRKSALTPIIGLWVKPASARVDRQRGSGVEHCRNRPQLTGCVVHTGKQAVNVANTLKIPEWARFDLGAR